MPTVLYTYDPLDRLIQTAGGLRFYNASRVTTEIQGAMQRSVFQVGDLLLAEGGASVRNLLGTDRQRSVLHTVNPDKHNTIAYNVYGYRPAQSGLLSVLGFNGEQADPVTGHYFLGNGYRAFNPVLMRFNSPDSWSPFGRGGLNSYAYCLCDPINLIDQDGHGPFKAFMNFFKKSKRPTSSSSIQRAPYSTANSPTRRHSSPSLLTASQSGGKLTSMDLIGFHGTSSNYTDSLEAGLDPKFMGKSTNMLLGDGLYFGTLDIAEDFSFRVADPYGPPSSRFGKPKVFGVYTENFDQLKPGEDYLVSRSVNISRRNPNGKFGAWNYREIVAKKHIYKKLTVRNYDSNHKVVSPRPYETPLSSRAAANVEEIRSLFFNKNFRQ